MTRTSPLGPPGPEDCTQGGQCHLLSRVWHNAISTCRVHPGCRASCGALPGEAEGDGHAGHQATDVAAKPPTALMEASNVYIRRIGTITPLAPLYNSPYQVLARQAKFFKLEIGDRQERVSVDRLKPHLGLAPVVSAAPPPPVRGQPLSAGLGYRL
jgi:hypothetical protein